MLLIAWIPGMLEVNKTGKVLVNQTLIIWLQFLNVRNISALGVQVIFAEIRN